MKFNIVYADPSWNYRVWGEKGKGRSAENHYPTMTLEDIKSLPVSKIADKDAVLFLWVTMPNLLEGLEVMKSWGFEYKTCAFNWFKLNRKNDKLFTGLGYYTRANSELCLLGTKGKVLPRKSRSVHQVIEEYQLATHIEEHSKKPDIVRDKIVELFGDLPRVELFARQKTEGWVCLGNEIDGKDIREALKEFY